jgi:8-oxo-dGTP diphosphatase
MGGSAPSAGGGIDAGEGLLTALHRECLEETGWRIRAERRLGIFHSYTYAMDLGDWVHKICHVYLARPTLRIGAPGAPGHRAVWMPIDAAVDRLASSDASTFLRTIERRMVRVLAPVAG